MKTTYTTPEKILKPLDSMSYKELGVPDWTAGEIIKLVIYFFGLILSIYIFFNPF